MNRPALSTSMLGPRWGSGEEFADERAEFLKSVATIPVMQRIALIGLEMLNLKPGDRVLDAGCGTGVFLKALAEKVAPMAKLPGLIMPLRLSKQR